MNCILRLSLTIVMLCNHLIGFALNKTYVVHYAASFVSNSNKENNWLQARQTIGKPNGATIIGKVLDNQNNPLEFVNVLLMSSADSAIVSTGVTASDGSFKFIGVNPGGYLVSATFVGFRRVYSPLLQLQAESAISLAPLMMREANVLQEVVVVANRPTIERNIDGFVVNMENSPLASGNSLQLLKSAPFVAVSASSELTLQGKKTLILLNGRQIPESSLQNVLQTLPAGDIARVELVTNPSAKYDASYGAVINIITRSAEIEGLTGNVRLEESRGKYDIYSGSSQLTYKHNKLTVYGMGGYYRRSEYYFDGSERTFSISKPAQQLIDNTIRVFHNNIYYLQAGADFKIGKNQTLGILFDGSINRYQGNFNAATTFNLQNAPLDSILETNSIFKYDGTVFDYNLNYHLQDESGKNDLSLLATYTPNQRTINQTFPSILQNPDGVILRIPPTYQINNPTNIKIFIGQVDYSHSFEKKWRLEGGVKYQYANVSNIVNYKTEVNNQFVYIPEFSSNTQLIEKVGAGYGTISKESDKNKYMLGLRIESTQANNINYFTLNYFNIFPTALYQHNFKKDISSSISYRREIERIPYFELVPYTLFLDRYTVYVGNTALRPRYNNVFSLNGTVKDIVMTLNYTSSKGTFARLPFQQDYATKITRFAFQNLSNSDDLSIDVYYPYVITSWWKTENSGSVFGYSRAEGKVLEQNFSLSSRWFNLKTNHIFQLAKNAKLEVSGYYYSSRTTNLTHANEYGNIDATLLLNVFKNKGELRIGGNDILKRNVYITSFDFGQYNSREIRISDSRRVSIGFTYKFGKTKIVAVDKTLGNEDAMKRTN